MTECSVCQSDCKGNDSITLPCSHVFHVGCIMPWFRSSHRAHGSCPQCRDNPFDATEVYGSSSVFALISAAARRKKTLPVVKKAYENFLKKKTCLKDTKKELAAFKKNNNGILKELRRLQKKVDAAEYSTARAKKSLCRLHPVVPVLIRHCGDSEL